MDIVEKTCIYEDLYGRLEPSGVPIYYAKYCGGWGGERRAAGEKKLKMYIQEEK